jgi:hypothetical protein
VIVREQTLFQHAQWAIAGAWLVSSSLGSEPHGSSTCVVVQDGPQDTGNAVRPLHIRWSYSDFE